MVGWPGIRKIRIPVRVRQNRFQQNCTVTSDERPAGKLHTVLFRK